MELFIHPSGAVHCLYGEQIDLAALGKLQIRRASYVNADDDGQWWAELAPVRGPKLGPFVRRSQALEAERQWLHQHQLATGTSLSVL